MLEEFMQYGNSTEPFCIRELTYDSINCLNLKKETLIFIFFRIVFQI